MAATESLDSDEGETGTRRHFPTLLILVVGFVLVVAGVAVVVKARASGQPRNVLVIMTDDQTLESLRAMPKVNELLVGQGTRYTDYYTTTPNCCPSRGGYYSGRYPHNNGVHDNIGPAGGAKAFIPAENQTIPVWLQQAGYYTAHIGKYLNGWGDPEDYPDGIKPRPGWTHWFGLIDPTTYAYFEYKVSDDGNVRSFGKAPEDYQTDVLGAEVIRSIDHAAQSKQPFFISFTPLAPHVGAAESANDKPISGGLAVPAPRHAGVMDGTPLPQSPSLAYGDSAAKNADISNKPAFIRTRVQAYPATEGYAIKAYHEELNALQAVDEWVEKIYNALRDSGQLDNTVIIFTSDNGLFHGEHGLLQKNLPYEEATHLPLVIRGPGFPKHEVAKQLALNLDLAPTILNVAGLQPPPTLDGRDLRPLANDADEAKDRAILLENFYPLGQEPNVRTVRIDRWAYTEWAKEKELYDLQTDPFQLKNVANDPAYAATIAALHDRLTKLATCAGATCEDSDASRL